MRRAPLLVLSVAMLAGCGTASPGPTSTPRPLGTPATPSPSTMVSAPAPSPSNVPTPSLPTEVPGPAGAVCPVPPSQAPGGSPVIAPFALGSGYQLSLSDGGIDNPPNGLVSLSDWNIATANACIADVLAFQFGNADRAASFAKEQASGIGLAPEKIGGTTVWFSASGDAARLAIGSLALNISLTVDQPTSKMAHDLVQSILAATPAM